MQCKAQKNLSESDDKCRRASMAAGQGTNTRRFARPPQPPCCNVWQVYRKWRLSLVAILEQEIAVVGTKGLTIHCAFDDPRRDQIVVHQACNERLRSPRTKRGLHFQALSAQAAPVLARQIGFYGCLVNEDKPIRMRLRSWIGDALWNFKAIHPSN